MQLRFDARNSPGLPEDVRERLERLAGSRLTSDGVIIIFAARFSSQERNRADARERLFRVDPPRRRAPRRAPANPPHPRLPSAGGWTPRAADGTVKAGRGKPGFDD